MTNYWFWHDDRAKYPKRNGLLTFQKINFIWSILLLNKAADNDLVSQWKSICFAYLCQCHVECNLPKKHYSFLRFLNYEFRLVVCVWSNTLSATGFRYVYVCAQTKRVFYLASSTVCITTQSQLRCVLCYITQPLVRVPQDLPGCEINAHNAAFRSSLSSHTRHVKIHFPLMIIKVEWPYQPFSLEKQGGFWMYFFQIVPFWTRRALQK